MRRYESQCQWFGYAAARIMLMMMTMKKRERVSLRNNKALFLGGCNANGLIVCYVCCFSPAVYRFHRRTKDILLSVYSLLWLFDQKSSFTVSKSNRFCCCLIPLCVWFRLVKATKKVLIIGQRGSLVWSPILYCRYRAIWLQSKWRTRINGNRCG